MTACAETRSSAISAKLACASARKVAGEQAIDPGPAEFAGRQADAVHDDQCWRNLRRPLIEMRRQYLAYANSRPVAGSMRRALCMYQGRMMPKCRHEYSDQFMRLTRCYVPASLHAGDTLSLPESASAHIGRVLRARVGEAVTLFNGQGGEYDAQILTIERRSVRVRIGAHRAIERESPLKVTLAAGDWRGANAWISSFRKPPSWVSPRSSRCRESAVLCAWTRKDCANAASTGARWRSAPANNAAAIVSRR
jgi:hypothetical protein